MIVPNSYSNFTGTQVLATSDLYHSILSTSNLTNAILTTSEGSVACGVGMCRFNTKSDTNYIIINHAEYTGATYRKGPRDVVVHTDTKRDMDKLVDRLYTNSSSISSIVNRNKTRFWRSIIDIQNGYNSMNPLGQIYINRPIPNPDMRFSTLANDPMLGKVPPSLRARIDPASIIPPATEDCQSKCVRIISVCASKSRSPSEQVLMVSFSLWMSSILAPNQQIRHVLLL